MAMRGILPELKFFARNNQVIGQIRASHVIQTRYPINDSLNKIVEAKCDLRSSSSSLLDPHNLNYSLTRRWKYGKKHKSKDNENDSDDDDDGEEGEEDSYAQTIVAHSKNAKIIKSTVSSMRIDAVVKTGLNMARNKVEIALYEGKLRVNGEKILKKGMLIKITDVIDFVQGPSPKNENFLLVSRITVLDASLCDDNYKIKILREKSLVIEDYKDSWKPVSSDT